MGGRDTRQLVMPAAQKQFPNNETATDAALCARDVFHSYPRRPVLRNLSLSLQRGEVTGLLGPNGAGKSTALRVLAAILRPDAGTLTIDGVNALRDPRGARRRVGYLPERPPLYPEMRVRDYLRFCAQLNGIPKAEVSGAVDRAMERCEVADSASRVIANLSTGYRQRVGIAQAVIHEPPVIILDEPTVGLDPAQIHRTRELISALRRDHAVLLSSHVLPEVQSVCDRVIILHHGEAVYRGDLNREDPNAVIIRLARPPAEERLHALDGVQEVQTLTERRYRLRLNGNEARDAVLRACVDQGWGLQEWLPPQPGLERLFLELTHGGPDS